MMFCKPAQLALLGLIAATTFSGCAVFQPKAQEIPVAVGESKGTYTIEMESAFGSKVAQSEIRGDITVQDVLKLSGATSKYRSMEILMVRQLPGQMPLKMPVEYDARKNEVNMHQNYAIHDGDHILVRAKSSSMMSQIFGSLGEM